LDSFAGP